MSEAAAGVGKRGLTQVLAPAGTPGGDVRKLAVFSVAAAAFVLIFFPVMFDPDSKSYIEFAKALLGDPSGNAVINYYRTPGYPAVLIATGVFAFNSFIGLIFFQTASAVVTPLLIYGTLKRIGKTTAYYCALFSIISLIPYVNMKAVLTDQLAVFAHVLLIRALSEFFYTNKSRYLYASSAVLFFMYTLRPSAAMLAYLVIFMAVVLRPRMIIHALVCVVLILAASKGLSHTQNRITGFSNTYVSNVNLTGKMLFYNAYHSSKGLIAESNGPASKELMEVFKHELPHRPDVLRLSVAPLDETQKQFFYGKYRNDMKGLEKSAFGSPATTYYYLIWTLLDETIGPEKSDALMLKTSVELFRAHPGIFAEILLRNLTGYTLTTPSLYWNYVDEYPRISPVKPNLYTVYQDNQDAAASMKNMPRRLMREVGFTPAPRLFTPLRRLFSFFWGIFFQVFRPVVFLMMLCAAPIFTRTKHGPLILTAFIIVAYQAGVTSVFNTCLPRYVYHTFLLELLCAAALLSYFFKRIMEKAKKTNEKN
ncbi:MAG TPA: hypothetical protein PLQ76_02725 [bacterium]|nr:hypothetical protein [bacterium]